jgi:hypothetical protein
LAESTLGDDVRAVGEDDEARRPGSPEPQRNSFIRSDQYSFILQGVPALAMKDGYLKGSKEEKMFKAWLTERYHSVTDDLQQPVDKQAAGKFNQLVAKPPASRGRQREKARVEANFLLQALREVVSVRSVNSTPDASPVWSRISVRTGGVALWIQTQVQ